MHAIDGCAAPKRPHPEYNYIPDLHSVHISKKQKVNRASNNRFPPAFWHNLSETHLTRRALQEFDRKESEHVRDGLRKRQRLRSRAPRVVNRAITPELNKEPRLHLPSEKYLSSCSKEDFKRLARTSRRGGPDLSDLRGCPQPLYYPLPEMSSRGSSRCAKHSLTSSSTKSSAQTTTTGTQSTGPYNKNFQQNLTDGRVFPAEYEYPDGRVPQPPDNWDEINRRLSEPRPSLSPSKFTIDNFKSFRKADAHAAKEKQVSTSVIPIIEGRIEDARCVSGGIPFTNLDHLTDGTLAPGNPDIYYGARPEQLDRSVREKLSCQIVPSRQDDLPIAPNFFLQAKGPNGTAAVAKRQACYDGALGARGMHSLRSYAREIEDETNAYTITSIYNDGTLKMFTSHVHIPSTPGDRPEYYMHQINTYGMTGNLKTFVDGATAYRNAREWTKEQRDEAIQTANNKERQPHDKLSELVSDTTEISTCENTGPGQPSRYLSTSSSVTTTSLETSCESSDLATSGFPSKRSRIEPTQTQASQSTVCSHDTSEDELSSAAATGLSQQLGEQALAASQSKQRVGDHDLQLIGHQTSPWSGTKARTRRKGRR